MLQCQEEFEVIGRSSFGTVRCVVAFEAGLANFSNPQ